MNSYRPSSFRRKRNTELAATLFMDSFRKNMEKGEITGAIFIDLSKAFDSLRHAQIIECLPSYGIYSLEKELITNYLFNRKQIVSYDRTLSLTHPVLCGVQHGSVLGPLLFLLAFNNIGEVLKNSKILLYAGDTVIYTCAKTKEEFWEKTSRRLQESCRMDGAKRSSPKHEKRKNGVYAFWDKTTNETARSSNRIPRSNPVIHKLL